MPEKYIDLSIRKYLDDLSAKLPAPGGGSAAALTASTGISLLAMVANFTLDKKGYEKHNDEIKVILIKLSSFTKEVSKLIDEDVAAYTIVSEAYKLPKNTEEEIKYRNEKIQHALKIGMSVPCKIFDISVDALPIAKRLLEIGNRNLLSDVACGASILKAAIESAKFNIDINLKFILDTNTKEQIMKKYETTLKTAFEDIDKIIQTYKNI
ncbi:MAG: hypothetical protein A2539_04875 [Elusimicrobia bacterium RIFOXYD2_FULL_34_15]|nr:MAG: hypothetical protein A2539_04875 [Elusimicrobia bacterium RIFOXYD2_FULL_34_15]